MKVIALLSAFMGLFFAMIAYFLLKYLEIQEAFLFSVFAGSLFCILLFLILLVYNNIIDKKYKKFEKIRSPIFYKTNGTFDLGNGTVRNERLFVIKLADIKKVIKALKEKMDISFEQ